MVLWARLSSSIAFSVGCCPVRLCWSSDFDSHKDCWFSPGSFLDMEPACQPEHLSPGTWTLPCYQQDCPPLHQSVAKVVSRCGGLALCGSLVFLLGNLTHPVWCAPDGVLNSGFLGLHNCIIGGYWVYCYLMWEWKSKRVGFLVLFCFQNISLVALRVGFLGSR